MEQQRTDGEQDTQRSGLRPVQIAAAALAAVTAAFLGSLLGVYGTVLGAGLISVVTTVGSELYLRSMERTKNAAHVLSGARREQRPQRPPLADQPTVPAAPQPAEHPRAPDPDADSARTPWWKRRWVLATATSVLAFVIGMAVITGYEGIRGQSISGDGGTTVSRIVGGGAGGQGKPERPGPAPDTHTPTTEPAEPSTPPADTRAPTGEPVPPPGSATPRPPQPTSEQPVPRSPEQTSPVSPTRQP
jgi:hypothetical protein